MPLNNPNEKKCISNIKNKSYVIITLVGLVILFILYFILILSFRINTVWAHTFALILVGILSWMFIRYMLANKNLCIFLYKWCAIIQLIALVTLLIISFDLISQSLDSWWILILLIILVGVFSGILVCRLLKNESLFTIFNEFRNLIYENSVGILITGLIISLFILWVIYNNPPAQIFIEPQKFEEMIPAGDSINKAISIKNLGSSDTNISIKTEFSNNWINIPNNFMPITSRQTNYVNFSINIPLQTQLGEYKGVIKIYKNNTADLPIYAIPVLLDVQPQAQFQATVDAPDEVNKTDYFKVKVYIKNVGAPPIDGVNLSLNISKAPALDIDEDKNETIGLIPKDTELSREWWIKVKNLTGCCQTVQVNINSNNAGNQTINTKINLS